MVEPNGGCVPHWNCSWTDSELTEPIARPLTGSARRRYVTRARSAHATNLGGDPAVIHALAIAYLAVTALGVFLPGSVYLPPKPRADWGSPHAYLAIASVATAVALAVAVIL